MAAISAGRWKDRAIIKSEVITEAWEVTKCYAGRVAEVVLFVCMVVNILELFAPLDKTFSNVVLGVQTVMLDIGGFSLTTMGYHASDQGDEKAAKTANKTGWFLIGLMMVTVLLVATGTLWTDSKPIVESLEKGLILVRVGMTVLYGHVIHSLRHSIAVTQVHPEVQQAKIEVDSLRDEVAHVTGLLAEVQGALEQSRRQVTGLGVQFSQSLSEMQAASVRQSEELTTKFVSQMEELTIQIATQIAHKNATENDTKNDTGGDTETATETATEDATAGATNITLLRTQKRSSARPKSRTTTDNGKAVKAMRYIRRNATIGATELAQKAQISVSYARKLLSENREKSEVVNQ